MTNTKLDIEERYISTEDGENQWILYSHRKTTKSNQYWALNFMKYFDYQIDINAKDLILTKVYMVCIEEGIWENCTSDTKNSVKATKIEFKKEPTYALGGTIEIKD